MTKRNPIPHYEFLAGEITLKRASGKNMDSGTSMIKLEHEASKIVIG